jgi:hypothetical protein
VRGLAVLLAGIVLVIGTAVLSAAPTESSEKEKPQPAPRKTAAQPARLVMTGKITGLTDTSLKLDYAVTKKVETMTFALEKPLQGFAVGDVVTVTYDTKDGKPIAVEVVKPGARPPTRAIVGKITELTDSILKLEWMDQGKPHTSEFILPERPISGIAVGFRVKVVFYTEGDSHFAVDVRIPESAAKKAGADGTTRTPNAAE